MKPVDKTVEFKIAEMLSTLFMFVSNITKKILQTKEFYTLFYIYHINTKRRLSQIQIYCSGEIFRCIIDDSFDCDDCDWFSLKAK